ncbi:helix-turn-helix transcriptional regulator [bacterium]|nr:helix-turn-helix transcriptional regulator [bacterium]
MNVKPYFWDLSEAALAETEKILRNPAHPKFVRRMVTLLSRCDKSKEIFGLINQKQFVEVWPIIRKEWNRIGQAMDFRDWWETVYEQVGKIRGADKPIKGVPPPEFQTLGKIIQGARRKKGWTQKDLAQQAKMRQPDISAIEKGKKNITQEVRMKLFRVLEVEDVIGDYSKQERIEREQINNFFNWFGLDMGARIERGDDPPDFYVCLPIEFMGVARDSRVAIELTEFCRDENLRRDEAEKLNLFGEIEKARKSKPALNSVSCSVFLNKVVNKSERDKFVNELLEFTDKKAEKLANEQIFNRFEPYECLKKYLRKSIIRKTDCHYISWNIASAAWLGLHEQNMTEFLARTKKMQKSRPRNLNEYWLLITCEPYLSCSLGEPDADELCGKLESFNALERVMETGPYDRVLIFERLFKRVLCWHKANNWKLLSPDECF